MPDENTIVETGKEMLTRVINATEPRLEVIFSGSGNYRGLRFTNNWNTDIIPNQDGSHQGTARGVMTAETGEFAAWEAHGGGSWRDRNLFVAEGSIVFTRKCGGKLADLSGREAAFVFEERNGESYTMRIFLRD